MRNHPRLAATALAVALATICRPTQAASPVVVSNTGYVKAIYVSTNTGFSLELDSPTTCPGRTVDGSPAASRLFMVKESASASMAVVLAALMGSRKISLQSSVLSGSGLATYCHVTSIAMTPPF